MMSLYELITTEEHMNKYQQFLCDKLIDFLQNVDIDIVSDAPLIRWMISEDYEKYNILINQLVSDLLNDYEDTSKMN